MGRYNKKWVYLIGFLLLLIMPFFIKDSYGRAILILVGINYLLGMSLNVAIGYIGLVSLGHAGFFALGAYSTVLIDLNLDVPLILSIVLGLGIVGLFGLIVGFASIKLGGIYLAITTFATAEIVRLVLLNLTEFTRGPMGLSVSRIARIGFLKKIPYELFYYYFILLMCLVAFYLVYRLINSGMGRAFSTIRGNEELARAIGINPLKYKILAFVLSSVIAGAAGVGYAYYFGILTPGLAGLKYTALALLIVIVGGLGTFWGPLIGSIVFSVIPELLRSAQAAQDIIFGLILIVIVLFTPGGLARSNLGILARTLFGKEFIQTKPRGTLLKKKSEKGRNQVG